MIEWMTHSIMRITNDPARRFTRTNPRYAKLYFGACLRFDLTLTEAALCDVVVVLSRKTGWCFASRAYLACILRVSERSVRRMITRLNDLKLLERKSGNPRQVRATMLWIAECQADDVSGQ